MEWIYKYISWGFFIGGSITAIGFLIRYLIQKKIDSYFNKQLEQYKQELSIISENIKYDINRKLFDFEAYASKKHTVYPELYRLLLESWDDISSIRFNFDIDIMFIKTDLDTCTLASRFYKEMKIFATKLDEAHDYFRKNDLYLSREASVACTKAFRGQSVFQRLVMDSFAENSLGDKWKDISFRLINVDTEHSDKVKDNILELKEILYKELSHANFVKEEALSK